MVLFGVLLFVEMKERVRVRCVQRSRENELLWLFVTCVIPILLRNASDKEACGENTKQATLPLINYEERSQEPHLQVSQLGTLFYTIAQGKDNTKS